jgi:hypothetical protein
MNIPSYQERTVPTGARTSPLASTAKRRKELTTEEEPRISQSFPVKKSQEHVDYELIIPQSFPIMKLLLEQAEEKCFLPMDEASLTCGNEINQFHAAGSSRGKMPWLTIKNLVPVVILPVRKSTQKERTVDNAERWI